ncbi:MAG: NADH-quinone oxidoreductase subunit J [Bdellovibrionales bacterium]|nr:NADH-quinone oxidoreductase subunit J [Bdellovibrionales bacterium]
MSLADLFVLICFLVGAVSAALVALHPNILYAAIALVFSLLSVGGLYAVLGADFLAGAQLIIYVGGIIVVILFAIMMSENVYRTKFLDGANRFFAPFIASLLILIGLTKLLQRTPFDVVEKMVPAPVSEAMGRALVGPYALVFQYVSIVLLAGLIGAVVVARPHYHEDKNHRRGS